ncbi:MAG: hypothetical protein ACRDQD_13755 [Nocardioidaceae bacterium]
MTPHAAQLELRVPVAPRTACRSGTPGTRALSTQKPAPQPTRVTYLPSTLTPGAATTQARVALAGAGLSGQVCRVLTYPAVRSGWLTTTALLRAGADPYAVAAVFVALPDTEIWCGALAVSAYRPITTDQDGR